MLEVEICRDPEERDDWHARWLTMQSAYTEYKRSSEALECTRQTTDDPVVTYQARLTLLEGRQRLAFERYIDARIAFLESRFDEINRPDTAAGAAAAGPAAAGGKAEVSTIKAWLLMVSGRPVLQTLAVMLLCTMAFSLMREQNRIRSLEAGRDELRAALVRTGREVQQLRARLDATPPPPPPAQRAQHIPAPAPLKPFAVPRPAGRKPSTQRSMTQSRPRQSDSTNRAQDSGATNRHLDGRPIFAFSLSPSREFKRVGPLSVLVKSVDPRKGVASLSIVSETIQMDVQHLKLNQPVWLNVALHDHALGLVANRITGNRVDGHLLEAESGKRDLGTSRLDTTP